MNGIGRAVWYAQWVALVGTPIWWVAASTFTGGGYGTLWAVFVAVPAFMLMLIGPIVGVASGRLRTARAMPSSYSLITLFAWLQAWIWPLSIPTASDVSTGSSTLGALGIPESAAIAIGNVCLIGFFLALLAGIVALIVSAVRASRPVAPSAIAPPPAPLPSES